MRLKSEKLSALLTKGLAPVYVVCGDEPLLTGEAADAIRAAARAEGYAERESHVVVNANQFKWRDCFAGLDNLSLFASRRIFELRMPNGKPGREGAVALTEIALNPPADTLFLLQLPGLDKRARASKWATTLEKHAVWVDVAAPGSQQLPAWLDSRAQQLGLHFEPDALEALAARTEGNLLAAQQEISRLALLLPGQQIQAAQIEGSVADGARFDVYQLADAAVAQELKRALRVLFALHREGTAEALICWALVREVSTLVELWSAVQAGTGVGNAMRSLRIWGSREPAYRKALQAHGEHSIRRLLACAALADRVVKGAHYGSPRQALAELVMVLAAPVNESAAAAKRSAR